MKKYIILVFLIFFIVFTAFSLETSDYNEYTWFHEYTMAYSYNENHNIYLGYETIFCPGFYKLPYPFSLFMVGTNANIQFQFETNYFFIRNQNFIVFPYPLFLGIDLKYNINIKYFDFSPILGICLFYPGLKIMLRKNIFKENDKWEVIFAISPPFYVIEKEW
jgi:hypothetical protein